MGGWYSHITIQEYSVLGFNKMTREEAQFKGKKSEK